MFLILLLGKEKHFQEDLLCQQEHCICMCACTHVKRERKTQEKLRLNRMICGLTTLLAFCFPVPKEKGFRDTIPLPSVFFQAWESDTTLGRIDHPLPLLEPAPPPSPVVHYLFMTSNCTHLHVHCDGTRDLVLKSVAYRETWKDPAFQEKRRLFFFTVLNS